MLIVWFFVYKKLAQFAVRCALPPRRSELPGCAADNKPSCVLHLLGSFIGSRGFSSLEQRPEFWVLHYQIFTSILHKICERMKEVGAISKSFCEAKWLTQILDMDNSRNINYSQISHMNTYAKIPNKMTANQIQQWTGEKKKRHHDQGGFVLDKSLVEFQKILSGNVSNEMEGWAGRQVIRITNWGFLWNQLKIQDNRF